MIKKEMGTAFKFLIMISVSIIIFVGICYMYRNRQHSCSAVNGEWNVDSDTISLDVQNRTFSMEIDGKAEKGTITDIAYNEGESSAKEEVYDMLLQSNVTHRVKAVVSREDSKHCITLTFDETGETYRFRKEIF